LRSISEERINALETTITELKEKLAETKSIYESCLADSNEKDRIITQKMVNINEFKMNENWLICVNRKIIRIKNIK
jgi:hypothetical protein